jgi:Methyltransferase domain
MATLETGSGASTVVFADRGANHVAISPAPDEHRRLAEYCRDVGVDLSRVTFIAEPSHTALVKTWKPQPLDIALVDGAHSFPFPVLDWFYVAPHVKVGGHIIVDDAFIPSVNVLVHYLRSTDAWQLDTSLGNRTVAFRKLQDVQLTWDWTENRFDRRPRFDYLPPRRRAVAWGQNLLFDRSPFQRVVRRSVARRGRRF